VAVAYSAGFEAGVAEGRAHAVTELAPVQTTFRSLIGSLERDQLAARQGAAENIYALALTVARWLFQREVEHDVGVVEALIRRAVSLLPAGTPIEVRGNPVDLRALGDHLEIREADGRPLAVHWIADPAIERGSFTLASPERLVDGRADVALRALYDRLVGS
jgi:flagellar biosynthesis/type III secretory pathway protein FliH